MRKLLAFLLILSSSHALATSYGPDQIQAQGQLQGQLQGQAQGQHQDATGIGVGVGVGKAEADANAHAGAAAGAISKNRNDNDLTAKQRTDVDVSNHSANLNLNGNANKNRNIAQGGDGGNAYAGGGKGGDGGDSYAKGGSAKNRNDIANDNRSSAHVEGDTIALDGGEHSQTNSQSNSGNNTTIGGDTVNQTYKEAASSAIAGYGNTTASCFRTLGLGGSTTSTGWSAGIPLKDKDCELGEDAAQAFMMGHHKAGWRMYCEQKSVRKVYGGKFLNAKSHDTARTDCFDEAMAFVDAQTATATNAAMLEHQVATLAKTVEDLQRENRKARYIEDRGFRKEVQDLGVTK